MQVNTPTGATRLCAAALIVAAGAIACSVVHAATGYYLVSVYSAENQLSVDYKYWNAKRHVLARHPARSLFA